MGKSGEAAGGSFSAWWYLVVVPAQLRQAAGRPEFIKSTGVHDKAVAKLAAGALLAGWRRFLLTLDNRTMDDERLLKLIDGASALAAGDHVALGSATDALGFAVADLVREASTGGLSLWCEVGPSTRAGYIVPESELELVDTASGPSGGRVRTQSQPKEAHAVALRGTILRMCDSAQVAGAILVDALESVDLVAHQAPGRPGWLYCPLSTFTEWIVWRAACTTCVGWSKT